jgi:antitoxin component YwqK of YwqJK toxin-antitoxin module
MKCFLMVLFSLFLSCAVAVKHQYKILINCGNTEYQSFKIVNENGLIVVTGNLKNGKLDDLFICRASTGETLSVVNYKEGRKNGDAYLWYLPASSFGIKQMKLQCKYVNDTLNGDKVSWGSDGKIRAKYIYKMGKFIKGWVFDYKEEINKEINPKLQAEKDEMADDELYRRNMDFITMFPDSSNCK